jgi:glycosyltransferase involved in cell wall biosynthesis
VRLGVYADLVYRRSGETISTDLAFIRFVTGLAPKLEELVVFGRLDPKPDRAPYALPREGVRFVPLPHYARVTAVGRLLRSARRARSVFAAELPSLDGVWLFGPHPLSLVFAHAARRRKVSVALGIRQDYPAYIRHRLPSWRWFWAVPAAHVLERVFRLLARRFPTVVVGEELGRRYGSGRAPLLATGFSLVQASDLVRLDDALARSWEGQLRLLSVGRLDPEKNPLLLPDVLAGLRRLHAGWHLTVAGDGPLARALERRIHELGLIGAVTLLGDVPYGPRLRELYRSSHAFLHVSLTEGLPQVVFEAMAAGLPIVATDVGGLAAALGDGDAGLLVPPRDAGAAIAALERLRDDELLRQRLMAAGLELVSQTTMEVQLERLEGFFRSAQAG